MHFGVFFVENPRFPLDSDTVVDRVENCVLCSFIHLQLLLIFKVGYNTQGHRAVETFRQHEGGGVLQLSGTGFLAEVLGDVVHSLEERDRLAVIELD